MRCTISTVSSGLHPALVNLKSLYDMKELAVFLQHLLALPRPPTAFRWPERPGVRWHPRRIYCKMAGSTAHSRRWACNKGEHALSRSPGDAAAHAVGGGANDELDAGNAARAGRSFFSPNCARFMRGTRCLRERWRARLILRLRLRSAMDNPSMTRGGVGLGGFGNLAAALHRRCEAAGTRAAAHAWRRWKRAAGIRMLNEGAGDGQLGRRLGALDTAIAAMKTAMGPTWPKTMVVMATEFGRTVRPTWRRWHRSRHGRRGVPC